VIGGLIYANRVLGYMSAPAIMQQVINRIGSRIATVIVDVDRIPGQEGLPVREPDAMGTPSSSLKAHFTCFLAVPIPDDIAFVRRAAGPPCAYRPGTRFQIPGLFRLSYCVDDACIEGGCPAGFEKAINKYRDSNQYPSWTRLALNSRSSEGRPTVCRSTKMLAVLRLTCGPTFVGRCEPVGPS